MGLYASYETINDKKIADYKLNPSSEFWEDFSGQFRFDLDKLWDVLHYVFTGYPTFSLESNTLEQSLLHPSYHRRQNT